MANVTSSNGIEKYPKLRFPNYTEPYKLMEFSKYADVNPKCGKVPNSFYYIDLECVNAGEIKDLRIEMAETAPSRAQRLLTLYDILFQTVRPYQKNNYHFKVENDLPTVASTGYAVFRTEQSSEYLYELIHTKRFLSDIMKRCTGTSFPAVSSSEIEDIAIWIPEFQEQKKIGDFLTLVDTKIAKQRMLIEHLKKYKRGLNIRLLSGISMSYSKRLGDVCSIIGGGTPDTTTAKFWDGGINWFTPSEIGKTKYVVSSVRSISYDGMLKSSAKLLPQNTVLLTTRATLGEMSILHAEATTNQGFQSLIPSNELLAEYVYYLQVIIKPWCEKYASGNTFREISKSALSNCVIPVPDISIQNKIVRVLSGIDQHIERENDILDKLREQKKALLQQLFI